MFEGFPAGGAMGDLMRSIDWRQTPVGAVESWPPSLNTAVSIMLSCHFPMYIVWGADYTQLYNDSYRPVLGSQKHPQAMGRSARETWAEIWDTVGPMFDSVMRTGKTISFDDFEFKLMRHGYLEDAYFSFSYSMIPGLHNKVGGVLVTVIETTARKRSDLRLARERERMNAVLTQAPVGICVLEGPEHTYTLCNDAYCQLMGGRRDLLGQSVRQAFPGVDAQGFLQLLDHVYNTGEPFVGRELPLHEMIPSGLQDSFVDFVCHPKRASTGQIDGIVAVVTEVTLQVTARQEVEKLATELRLAVATRDEFMSIASHELKTPITSLKLQLEMTRRRLKASSGTPLSRDKLAAVIDTSSKQVERLITLVEDLLDVSRIQAGKIEYGFATMNVAEVVHEVVERFTEQLEQAKCPVTVDVSPELTACWDRSRIEQVLTNLISNATKYAPGSLIHVQVAADHDTATLLVQDFGPGIAQERQAHIFERYARASSSRNISGLGLGLFIANQIVLGHQGTIHVESAATRGTRFVVQLPLQPFAPAADGAVR